MSQIRRHTAIFTLISIVSDGMVLLGSMLLAFWVSFHSPLTLIFPVAKGIPPISEYLKAFPVILVVFLIVFKSFHLYRRKTYFSPTWHFFTFTKAVTVALFSLMALTFLYREDFTYSRRMLAWSWVFCIILITLFRRVVDRLEVNSWKKNKAPRKILLLGAGEMARRLIENFSANPRWGAEVVGVLSFNGPPIPDDFTGLPIQGRIDQFEEILRTGQIDEIGRAHV